jgi:hypothetical protein
MSPVRFQECAEVNCGKGKEICRYSKLVQVMNTYRLIHLTSFPDVLVRSSTRPC